MSEDIEQHDAVYEMEIGNGQEHMYEVTLAYVKGDKHNPWDNNKDRPFGWAELEDHTAVVYKYSIQAYTIAEATNRALKIDDARKLEQAATWPSVFSSPSLNLSLEELQSFYHYLMETNQFDDWFYAEPTSISVVLKANKQMVFTQMENRIINKAENFTSDISEWMKQEEE